MTVCSSLAPVQSAPQQACPYLGGSGGTTQRHTRARPPAADGLFIVRFKEYAMAEDHHTTLQAALPGDGSGGWEWVQRRNPAAVFPTDFALLRLAPAGESVLKVGSGH